jgi:hypothetical protein
MMNLVIIDVQFVVENGAICQSEARSCQSHRLPRRQVAQRLDLTFLVFDVRIPPLLDLPNRE